MATTKTASRPVASLEALGFSEIEALVYCFLLSESPATGYRISHGIGKPTPNTYKAIASLEARGAILVDDGDSRLCRAAPPEELLGALDRRWRGERARAAEALAEIAEDSADNRVYQLRDPVQVIERAASMLSRAREIALVDAFPAAFSQIRGPLEETARRGVRVFVKAYAEDAAKGVTIVRPADSAEVLALWPGEHLSLVTDAQEHLVALFERDLSEVHQSIWTNSAFLSCMQHNHLALELIWTSGGFPGRPDPQPGAARLRAISLLRANPPGLRRLVGKVDERGGSSALSRKARGKSRGGRPKPRFSRRR